MTRRLDPGPMAVAGITLVLFVAALFVRGFTHDLLTEAAIFLVSVKIIMMAYKNSVGIRRINDKFDSIIRLEKEESRCLEEGSKEMKSWTLNGPGQRWHNSPETWVTTTRGGL